MAQYIIKDYQEPKYSLGLITVSDTVTIETLQEALWEARDKACVIDDWNVDDVISMLPSEWNVKITSIEDVYI